MRRTRPSARWVAIVADANGASVFAVGEQGGILTAVARCQLRLGAGNLDGRAEQPDLRQFVRDNQLAGCPAHLHFVGSGTVVQKLQMPPMSSRNRARAVRTRLTNYAGGRDLVVDTQTDRRSSTEKATHLLVAGVDARLARGLYRVCRKARLRPASATGLAAAFAAPSDQNRVVQLVLTERTTTIQLFDGGQLVSCRDILLGRRDFVAAYQRPILTENGPVTLAAEQADRLTQEVGVPVEREDEVLPGIRGRQLWPLLNPVLQRLRNEIEQTLAHSLVDASATAAINLVSLPAIPGLGEYLAGMLRLSGPLIPTDQSEACYLAALASRANQRTGVDLRPPEERFVARSRKPALAACLAAVLVIAANSTTLGRPQAQATVLTPAAEMLRAQLARTREQRAAAQQSLDELAGNLRSQAKLRQVLPPDVPTIGIFKSIFRSVPAGVRLLEVTLDAEAQPASLVLRAEYGGGAGAGVTAARWARSLTDSAFFADADVTAVTGKDDANKAVIEIHALVRGG